VLVQGKRSLVFDAGSDRLLRVDACVARVLATWSRVGSRERVAGLLSADHAAADVARAWDEIDAARQRGLLLPVATELTAPDRETPRELREHGRQSLTLSVTEDCNLRCRYCLYGSINPWVRPHRRRAMSPRLAVAAVARFLDHAATTARPVISFYGGEPLLNLPAIAAVGRFLASHRRRDDVRLVIDTNGVGLTGAAADLVLRYRLFLQVSLDGPAAVHDRYRVRRGGAPTHRRVESALTRLLAADPTLAHRLRLQITLMPDADLERIDAYFAAFPPFRSNGLPGSPALGVSWADLRGVPVADEVLTSPVLARRRRRLEAARGRFVAACRQRRRHELGPVTRALFEPALIRWYHGRGRSLPRRMKPAGCCLPGVRKLHVRADGTLQPCERVGRTMILGTVAQGIDPLAVRGLWERFLTAAAGRCGRCWAVRHCTLCFTVLAPSWNDGAPGPWPERLCRAIRRQLADTLRLYADIRGDDGEGAAWLRATSVT